MDMDLQISKLQTVTYREFVDSLPYVSHLTLYKCEPLEGICILDIAPRLGLAIVDRLMGGPGRSAEDDRDMSDIELALLDQAVNVLLSEWCNHWDELREHRPTIIGHEQHGRFLHTASPKSVILMLAMEARFGDCVEQIQFAFPYDELEPMVRRLRAEMDGTQKKETGKDELQSRWKSQLDSIPVKVVADFPGVEITARELTQLTVGEVLPLDAACPRQIRVSLAGKPKYLGQLGAKGDSRAIMLTRPYDS
jgi:flagellar motor switch protein FliM